MERKIQSAQQTSPEEGHRKAHNEFDEEGHSTQSMIGDSTSNSATIDKQGSTGVTSATNIVSVSTSGIENDGNVVLKTNLLAKSGSVGENTRDYCDLDPGVPKGCQFSPDGTCLLTARANKLELYNTPYEEDDGDNDDAGGNEKVAASLAWEPALTCNSGESVRSYAWYPHMKSSDPATCCFVGVSRDSPVQLYDAYDGSIRASYRPYNRLDEMESPTTLCFVENGQKLVTGGLRTDRILHVFDVNRPGRDHATMLRLGKTRRSKDGQKGLVSAMAYSEQNGVIAVGTYSPGSIYLYDLRAYTRSAVAEITMSSSASTSSGGTICLAGHGKKGRKNKRKRFSTSIEDDDHGGDPSNISGSNHTLEQPSMNFSAAKLQWYQSRTRGGVTQVEFENENGNGGSYLFSTSRRSNAILQWDLRKLSSSNFCPGIASFQTNNDTNQRIEFRIQGDQLWTGGIDGCVKVYSYKRQGKDNLLTKLTGFRDCVNGISLHPDNRLDLCSSNSKDQLVSEGSNESKDGAGLGCNKSDGAKLPEKSLLAIAVGRRHFPSENDWEDDDPHTSLTNRTKHFVGSTQIHSFEIKS